jgi:hypothetical protein
MIQTKKRTGKDACSTIKNKIFRVGRVIQPTKFFFLFKSPLHCGGDLEGVSLSSETLDLPKSKCKSYLTLLHFS